MEGHPHFECVLRGTDESRDDKAAFIRRHVFQAEGCQTAILASIKLSIHHFDVMQMRVDHLEVGTYRIGKVVNGMVEHTNYNPFYSWSIFHDRIPMPNNPGLTTYRPLRDEYAHIEAMCAEHVMGQLYAGRNVGDPILLSLPREGSGW
jgi:hypothetical protein